MLEVDDKNENLIGNNINSNNNDKVSTSAASSHLNILEEKFNKNKEKINGDNIEEINNRNIENNDNDNDNENVKHSFIIEDNIEKSDTSDLFGQRKLSKPMKKDIEDIYYEGDEDLDSKLFNKYKKSKNNFKYHININKTLLKYLTLVTIIVYIIVTFISCVVFHYRRDDNKPFLFCFEFLDRIPQQSMDTASKDVIYFLTDLNSFYIIHSVLLFIFISVCYLLIKGEESDIDDFFKDMSIFFFSTLIFNIPILISGMFSDTFYGSHLRTITYLILTLIGFIFMIKIYIVAKRHKYKNISRIINISVLSSFMTAYQCYCFIFCLTYFYMNFFKPNLDDHKEYLEVEIIAGFVYFSIGIVCITVFKDIFFNIAIGNIEIGLLYSKRKSDLSLVNTLINISFVSLNFASIIIVIFKYNKRIFRLKDME